MSKDKASDDPGSPSSYADRQREASQRLRDASRYLVVAFGAVAATLIAGLGLTRLDNLSADQQTQALSAAAVAIVGVVVLLVLSVWLAAASSINANEILNAKRGSSKQAREVIENQTNGLLSGHESFEGLLSARQQAWEAHRAAWKDYTDGADNVPHVQRANVAAKQMDRILEAAMATASHQRLRYRFVRSTMVMGVAALVTAVGVLSFAWATNPVSGSQLALVGPTPTAGQLDVAEGVRSQVRARLGAACGADLGALPVLILGLDDEGADVLTVADNNCAQVRLQVDDDIGILEPRTPAAGADPGGSSLG